MVMLEEYVEKERHFLLAFDQLVAQLFSEESAIASKSPSADIQRAQRLSASLIKAISVVHDFTRAEESLAKEAVHKKALQGISKNILLIQEALLRIYKKPPKEAADLFVHSRLIEELQQAAKQIRAELKALEADSIQVVPFV